MIRLRASRPMPWVLELALLGILGMATGCSDSTPGPNDNTDPNDNPGIDRKNAREKAFGKAGVPQGKQAAPVPAK
jgi:hypothetical protein